MTTQKVKTVLLDRRSSSTDFYRITDALAASKIIGLDCETEDSQRHEGLNKFCKYDADGFKGGNSKLVFDMQRTTVCGFSVYPDGGDTAWYVNLAHADVENRIPWALAREIIQAKPKDGHWICHNAPFELTVFRNSLKEDLQNVICTLQLAVSTYGPDEYNKQAWINAGLGAMEKFVAPLMKHALTYEGGEFEGQLADIVIKIIAKESRAAHSYNGFCNEHRYGYGLKQAVKSFFGVEMSTFQDTLGENAHMGQLTGDQVAAYGAEDAYWAVQLLHHLLKRIAKHAPNAIGTFMKQENPMIHVYSDIWAEGMRIDRPKVDERRNDERAEFARLLRELKIHLKTIGKFPDQPDERMMRREKWYAKGVAKYRKQILDFANAPDHVDDYKQAQQVRAAVSNAWAGERGEKESTAVNLTHYMPMRVLLYDLIGAPMIMSKGKVQSNGEARGKIIERLEKKSEEVARQKLADAEAGDDVAETEDGADDLQVVDEIEIEQTRRDAGVKIIDCITKLAGVEQRMKLYLTPYVLLTDPVTNRMYPTVSSQLATRRMAASNPNPMQLQKRGDGVYVRSFYLGDTDDDVVVSIDWSGIELVTIGEFSGDREFLKAFGQIPHADLHTGTAVATLSVEMPWLIESHYHQLKKASDWDNWRALTNVDQDIRRLSTNLKGLPLKPEDAAKYWRNELGKVANFGYFYSGWLGPIGDRMGWSMDKTGEAVERFRQRFPEAEAWRLHTIEKGRRDGWIELPDGHRRVRWEATDEWMSYFMGKWPDEDRNFRMLIQKIASKIQKRAHNQLVNAEVQGTCGTLAKRSSLRIKRELIIRDKMPARFLIPVHDELVFSCKREAAPEFIEKARAIMIDHPDLFKLMKLDASPSVGINFAPYQKDRFKLGQVELYEPPEEIVGKALANTRLDRAGTKIVIDHLFATRDGLKAAA